MFPASTKGGGQIFAFPDVCKVPAPPGPPMPVPFPNTGMLNTARGDTCTQKVKIMNQPVIHKGTQLSQTMGDEAGVAGGVVSGMNMGPACFKQGASNVLVEGNEIVTVTKPSAHNGSNANAPGGMVVAPSQAKVLIVSR
jgi:hypothetical protein